MESDNGQINSDTSDLDRFRDFYLNLNTDNDDSQVSCLPNLDFPRYNNTCVDNFKYYTIDEFNHKFANEQESFNSDLKFMNYNVRGINCNYDNLVTYLVALNVRPDILVLTECHITKDNVNIDLSTKFKLEGYNLYYCKSVVTYGGVIIYVKENIKASYNEQLCETNEQYDALYLDIGKIDKKSNFTIGGLYRHCRQKVLTKYVLLTHYTSR